MHFVPGPSLHIMGYATASPYSFLWLVHNTLQDTWWQILPHLSCLSTQLRRYVGDTPVVDSQPTASSDIV